MKATLNRSFLANIILWDIKQVEQGKKNALQWYLELTYIDKSKESRLTTKEMRKKVCIFLDQDDKENIELFKKEKAEGKAFFINDLKFENHRVAFDYEFVHLYQEDSDKAKTDKTFKKGDMVCGSDGEPKWVSHLDVDVLVDERIRIESPETTAFGIVDNEDLCQRRPTKTEGAVATADAV